MEYLTTVLVTIPNKKKDEVILARFTGKHPFLNLRPEVGSYITMYGRDETFTLLVHMCYRQEMINITINRIGVEIINVFQSRIPKATR